MEGSTFGYEPMPRAWHCSISVRNQCYVIGGCPQIRNSLSMPIDNAGADLQSKVEVFDVRTEQWKAEQVTGSLPKGYGGASSIVPSYNCIYWYGGEDTRDPWHDQEWYGDLLQLNLETLKWSRFSSPSDSVSHYNNKPLKKSGSGMVSFESNKKLFLGLFGGCGVLPGEQNPQSGSIFVKFSWDFNEGWSNEFHVLDLTEGILGFSCFYTTVYLTTETLLIVCLLIITLSIYPQDMHRRVTDQ